MGNNVTVDLGANNAPLKSDLEESKSLFSNFGDAISGTMSAVGSIIETAISAAFEVGKTAFTWGKDFVAAASESRDAESKLESVITATGKAAGWSTQQMVAYADSMERTTKFGSETVQGAQAIIATFRNIRGDVFNEATSAAADMATVLGTDLKGASMQLGKALNDPVAGLAALTRSGVTFTDAQEKMINTLVKSGDVMGAQRVILQELQHEFGGAAVAAGSTFSGQTEIMKNRLGNLGEEIGGVIINVIERLAPLAEPLVTFAENAVKMMVDIAEPLPDMVSGWVSALKPTFEWLGDMAVAVFTGIQSVILDWEKNSQRSGVAFQVNMVQAFAGLEHLLLVRIPGYLSWFWRNWYDIFVTIGNFTKSVVVNMWTNLSDFFDSVANFLAGNETTFKWTGLLEGFENTIKELPQIAERVPTEMEKTLLNKLKKIDDELAKTIQARYEENRAKFRAMFETAKKENEEAKVDAEKLKFDPKAFTVKEDKPEKDKKEKERHDRKKDHDEQKMQMEDLASLHKRISLAAATIKPPSVIEQVGKGVGGAAQALAQGGVDAFAANAGAVKNLAMAGFDKVRNMIFEVNPKDDKRLEEEKKANAKRDAAHAENQTQTTILGGILKKIQDVGVL